MDFETPGSFGPVIVTKLVEYKPLGFTFDKQMPMIVDHVVAHSVAEELGIQTGWTVVRIGEKDITAMNFLDVFHLLQDKVGPLPKKPKRALGGVEGRPQSFSQVSNFSITSSRGCTSLKQFAEPCQTLVFVDWDDTLFPTTEITDRWKLPYRNSDPLPEPSPEQRLKLSAWESALESFFEQVLQWALRCTVVTAAKRGWVTTCVERFAPRLKRFFENDMLRVVYAVELVQSGARDVDITRAKCAGMTQEAKSFYSQYDNQSWKNILSIGDMPMERDALRRMANERAGATKHERLRTKTILLPTDPTISEITLRLKFDCTMMPTLVRFDGDFDIDLKSTEKAPLQAFATGLDLPFLAEIEFPGHAWGRAEAPDEETASAALSDLYLQVEGLPPDGVDEADEEGAEASEEAHI